MASFHAFDSGTWKAFVETRKEARAHRAFLLARVVYGMFPGF